jgi:hypothetical protein
MHFVTSRSYEALHYAVSLHLSFASARYRATSTCSVSCPAFSLGQACQDVLPATALPQLILKLYMPCVRVEVYLRRS